MGQSSSSTGHGLTCSNCGQPLDVTDRFCRECGLPTVRQAEAQRQAAAVPLDTAEMKRALDIAPEPKPFTREEEPDAAAEDAEDSTGSVVKATSPTQAMRLAIPTAIMITAIMFLAGVGVVLLIMALKP
jgi:hypothetical protein